MAAGASGDDWPISEGSEFLDSGGVIEPSKGGY